MSTKLVVIIATHNRNDLLARTLRFLTECHLPENYACTIVVENGGRFGAESVVAEFRSSLQADYIYSDPPSKSKALNLAVENINDALVVFLDDDVRASKGLLDAYARAASGEEGGQFFGGPLSVDYEVTPPEWIVPYLPGSAKGWDYSSVETVVNEPVFLGGNWAAFSEDIKASGGFDTSMGPRNDEPVGEDTQMQRQLLLQRTQGLYLPAARVWHYVPSDRCSAEWTLDRAYRNGIKSGWVPPQRVLPRAIAAFVRELLRFVYRAARFIVTRAWPNSTSHFQAKYFFNRSCGHFRGRWSKLTARKSAD